jgi:type IV pilus assembly protein PilA
LHFPENNYTNFNFGIVFYGVIHMRLLSRTKSFRRLSKGFTLIELMIAIAIVGVLAAIAVPAYSNYLARARVAEAVNYAQSCKTGYVEFYSTNGSLPTNNLQANCPNLVTANVQSVAITSTAGAAGVPAVRVRLSTGATSPLPSAIRDHVIVLQPLDTGGAALQNGDVVSAWRCSITTAAGAAPSTLAQDLVPTICRNPQPLV